jgi:NAD(P)-dependent dehydrogenase (short-subunit alcohol dehydrogenase family)
MSMWKEEVALVTGAGAGIGRATAVALEGAGARVLVSDVDLEGAEQTAEQSRRREGTALVVQADMSRSEQVAALVERATGAFRRLDFAFNNAGVEGKMGTTAVCTEEIWDRTIATNLKGVWLCMKYELAPMLLHGRGAIVSRS